MEPSAQPRRFTSASFVASTLLLLGSCLAVVAADAVWLDVPFVKQPEEGCGAASISMVMQYWFKQQGWAADSSTDVAQIQNTLYSPNAHGIYASAMEAYLRQHSFQTFAIHGEWSDLEQQLTQGRPLIVSLKPNRGTTLHYVVVAGMDSSNGMILLNDPAVRKLLKRDRASFEKEWNAANNWLLLALPSVPAS